jgi:hypothetical protein
MKPRARRVSGPPQRSEKRTNASRKSALASKG